MIPAYLPPTASPAEYKAMQVDWNIA